MSDTPPQDPIAVAALRIAGALERIANALEAVGTGARPMRDDAEHPARDVDESAAPDEIDSVEDMLRKLEGEEAF